MKSVFKSKTMWLNAVTVILSVIALINPELLGGLGMSTETQHKVLTATGFIVGVLNMILRMNTSESISVNPTKET